MENRELTDINESGEQVEIKLGGTGVEKVVLTAEQLGNYSFDGNDLKVNGETIIQDVFPNAQFVILKDASGNNSIQLGFSDIQVRHEFNTDDYSILQLLENQALLSIDVAGEQTSVFIDSIIGIRLVGQTIAKINAGDADMAPTKEWVESKITGASGSFTAQTGEVVTVENGLITDIT